jgi:hypothetical protein
MELLGHINNHVPSPVAGASVPREREPHPYDKRYLHGRFGAQFMLQRRDRDLPIVWVTRQGRQTRLIGLYYPVHVLVLYPAPPEASISSGPIVPLTRAQEIALSTEYMNIPDHFFGCFFSVGASVTIRNPCDILIIRVYMKYFTELCEAQSRKSLNSDSSRSNILKMEIIDGVCLSQFFNSHRKAAEHIRNTAKRYGLSFDQESTIDAPSGWKSVGVLTANKQAIVAAAIKSVHTGKWNAMVNALKKNQVIPVGSEVFNSVSFLAGTSTERRAMDTLIRADKFKCAVISVAEERGKLSIRGDQSGTLLSGVLTIEFLQKMKAIRVSWARNRKILLSKERTEEEATAALTALDSLIATNSNKLAGAHTYLH